MNTDGSDGLLENNSYSTITYISLVNSWFYRPLLSQPHLSVTPIANLLPSVGTTSQSSTKNLPSTQLS